MPAPICQLLYCTTVLFKILYCKIKNVYFLCLLFMYHLWEKYCKPIAVQYYTVDCVSWVPRLTLLDLRTNWTYEHALGTELIRMYGTYCTKQERMQKHKCVLRVKFYSKLHALDFDDTGAKPWKHSLYCKQGRADVEILGSAFWALQWAPETVIKLMGLNIHPNAYGSVRLKAHPRSI